MTVECPRCHAENNDSFRFSGDQDCGGGVTHAR
jgi:hypothetical protein